MAELAEQPRDAGADDDFARQIAVSGGSSTDRSPMISTITPPAPKVTTGPNTGSVVTPTISSRPLGRLIIGSTTTPSTRAWGRAFRTELTISWKAVCTACALPRFRRTPPASDLCVMSGELIFSAAGMPSSSANSNASPGDRATIACATGMRNAASTALDSISLSTPRRSTSAASISRRAPSASGADSGESGPGACMSNCWLR